MYCLRNGMTRPSVLRYLCLCNIPHKITLCGDLQLFIKKFIIIFLFKFYSLKEGKRWEMTLLTN